MPNVLIWVVVAVVVVLLAAGLLALYLRRRRAVFRDRAVELRRHALFQSEDVPVKEADARGARAAADEARLRADELESEARQKEAALERARSRVEDTVREADRIDPEVRHKAGDYVPSLSLDEPDQQPNQQPEQEADPQADTRPPGTTGVEGSTDLSAADSAEESGPGTAEKPTAGQDGPARTPSDAPFEQPPPPSGRHAG